MAHAVGSAGVFAPISAYPHTQIFLSRGAEIAFLLGLCMAQLLGHFHEKQV